MTVPKLTALTRLYPVGYGLVVLVWLSLEGSSTLPPALLGIGLAVILFGWIIMRRHSGERLSERLVRRYVLMGGFSMGAGGAILSALLMFFKSSWHGHIVPDYPFGMITAMLWRAPLWGIAGLLLAVGVLLLQSNPQSVTGN